MDVGHFPLNILLRYLGGKDEGYAPKALMGPV
jgi:hypothetical protein